MIIPSIDIMGGKAVQLRRGRELVLTDARDPVELARTFNRFGPVAVVDLDAAMGKGENTALIARCCRVAECRVGGGVRTEDDVRHWIRRGASKVMIGTRAAPEFLRLFPREWTIACLDAVGREVVVEGWTKPTGADVIEKARALEPCCGELLFTQVEKEGMLGGFDAATARRLRDAVGVPVTIAGGVTTLEDVKQLEELGCHSQVGRALYENKLDLADVWTAVLRFNEDGLIATIVQDADSGQMLMFAYGSAESLREALSTGRGVYWSRSRREIWRKGDTSGNVQELVEARWDCDRDAVLFRVRQRGPACHRDVRSCFAVPTKDALGELERTLDRRRSEPPSKSYTAKLIHDPELLASKLREETEEVIEATERSHIVWECADVLYHLMARMQAAGIAMADVENELRARFKP